MISTRIALVTLALVSAVLLAPARLSGDGGFQETCRTVWMGGALVCSNPCVAGCDDSCRTPATGDDYDQYCKCSSGDCNVPTCCYLMFRYSDDEYLGVFVDGDCGAPSCNGGPNTTCQLEQVVVPVGQPARWVAACRI